SLCAPSLDYVFQPRQLAIVPVAEIAVNRNGGLCHCQQLVWPHKPDRVGKTRMAGTHTVALSKAAACEQREAGEHAAVEVRDEAQVVTVDIGGVLAFVSKSDLELARQVSIAVKRLNFLLEAGCPLTVQPDFEIGLGARFEFACKLHHVRLQI